VRSRAWTPGLREVRRPNSSFKPTPLHGREFFRYVAFSVAAVQRCGLTQVLGHMPRFALAIITLVVAGSAWAGDPPSLVMQPQKGCSIVPLKGKTSVTRVERIDSKIKFTVQANTYCMAEPINPNLQRAADTSTISIEYDTSKSFHNCFCAKTISFEISNLSPEIKTIYFVQDGRVTGHGYVP